MHNAHVRKISSWLFLLIAIWLVSGCQHDPYADWFIKQQVSDEAILGTYVVTDDTIRHFATKKFSFVHGETIQVGRDAKIVVTGDHKIYFSSVPLDALNDQVCVLSGDGVWELAKNDDFTIVQVSLGKSYAGRKMPGCPDGEFGFQLNLFDDSLLHWRSHREYPVLHLTVGDPDSGDALQFQRQ